MNEYPKRILVCGGRDYTNRSLVAKTLYELLSDCTQDEATWMPPKGTVIIHGGANGADSLADEWATVKYATIEKYMANWSGFGKAAGHIRNTQMLKEGKPDIVVAFPGGRGTANMVKQAEAAGVEVHKVEEHHGD